MIMLTIVDLFEFDQNLDRSTPAQLSYVMKSDLLWNFTFSFLHFSWQRRSASLWKLIEKVDMGAGKSWKLIWEQRKVPAWDCPVRSHHYYPCIQNFKTWGFDICRRDTISTSAVHNYTDCKIIQNKKYAEYKIMQSVKLCNVKKLSKLKINVNVWKSKSIIVWKNHNFFN